MKKVISILAVISIMLSLAACSGKDASLVDKEGQQLEDTTHGGDNNSNNSPNANSQNKEFIESLSGYNKSFWMSYIDDGFLSDTYTQDEIVNFLQKLPAEYQLHYNPDIDGVNGYTGYCYGDGLFWVKKVTLDFDTDKTEYGCIDINANVVVPFSDEYTYVLPFSEGRAFVLTNYQMGWNYGWLIIDKTGAPVCDYFISRSWNQYLKFKEGHAIISKGNEGKSYIVDLNGNVTGYLPDAIHLSADVARHGTFSEGLFWFKYIDESGYFDYQGNCTIDLSEYKVTEMGDFSNGVAGVGITGKDEKFYNLKIDKNGNFLNAP